VTSQSGTLLSALAIAIIAVAVGAGAAWDTEPDRAAPTQAEQPAPDFPISY